MTDIVIQAENLGKKYTTGHQAENGRDAALRDVLVNNAHSRATQTWCVQALHPGQRRSLFVYRSI